MTKPDNLDEVCRDVVEWMDGWEHRPDSPMGLLNGAIATVKDGEEHLRPIGDLWTSLDVIREVEKAMAEDYPEYLYNLEAHLPLADAETRLRVIYRTLKENKEV